MNIKAFLNQIQGFLPSDRIIQDELRRLAYGTDASFYRLIPQIVLQTETEAEIIGILKAADTHHVPVTFRAAGTSLSGQAITEYVLITLGNHWQGHKILNNGYKIALQPGVTGAKANAYLTPFGRKIGPDPASINAAKIGGIAANNASGMCCGTAQNTYYTVDSMRLILADGTLVDTADHDSCSHFRQQKADLLNDLSMLASEVQADSELVAKIRHKYRLKNTTGYAINALVDFKDPIDILQHLMIGSEGTLGFMAEIRYNTVKDAKHKASALLFYTNIGQACAAVNVLKHSPVAAVELMDWAALNAVRHHPVMAAVMPQLTPGYTALLVETRANDAPTLLDQIQKIQQQLREGQNQPHLDYEFSLDSQLSAQYWAIRKGIFPAVGAVRTTGSTVLIEDVAYPVERLADAVQDLHHIFKQWGYENAVIFGHALEGNLHFVFPQSFDSDTELKRYESLMEAVATMTVDGYQGSLKAEHGTGRNMAPFVEREWGSKAYQIMQRLKAIIDPKTLLNPGVILNNDPKVHLQNIKPLPATHVLVDACIECGFCEPACPSKSLTLTPRQRIVIQREISRLQPLTSAAEQARLQQLTQDYQYQGIDTCAGCGLCSTLCPVGINTGDLTRALRQENNRQHNQKAKWVAKHFSTTTQIVKIGLGTANIGRSLLGHNAMQKLTQLTDNLSGGRIGHWRPALPKANTWPLPTNNTTTSGDKVVYFASCASRTMGIDPQQQDKRPLTQLTCDLLHKAGYEIVFPTHLSDLCCGMPFQSKGFLEIAESKRQQLITALRQASENGRYPILIDTSPCASQVLKELAPDLTCFDPIGFALEKLLPRLDIHPTQEPLSLHITCSTTKDGLADKMVALAKQLSNAVFIPKDITCCGFAGDKGFSTPELNASALAPLKDQLPADIQRGVSSSRTCEIGLSEHAGVPYQSILYLLDEVSQPIKRHEH